MVDCPRFPIRSKYALKPVISSALSLNPPEGFLVPPALIDRATIRKTDLKLREQQNIRSYDKLTSRIWNEYVQLGIQHFASPNLYQTHIDTKESSDEKSLHRLARYFRFHLENKADCFLSSSRQLRLSKKHSAVPILASLTCLQRTWIYTCKKHSKNESPNTIKLAVNIR